MSYFLKKTKNKKGTYLQIYESVYDPERGYGVHRSVKPIGYVHELRATGIEDPVAHFKREVEQMNDEAKRKKGSKADDKKSGKRVEEIGDATPLRWLGHFALRAVWAGLGADTDFSNLQLHYDLPFPIGELLVDLACARVLCPSSEGKPYHKVLPRLAHEPAYTAAQINDGLAFLGREREKVIEFLGDRLYHTYPHDTSRIYFVGIDSYRGTNPMYDLESDATLSVSLLLDAACAPLGMDLRISDADARTEPDEVIAYLKERYGIEGHTVRVSDVLDSSCATTITDAVRSGDRYLCFRTADRLDEGDVAWLLSEDGWEDCGGINGKDHLRTKSTTIEATYQVVGRDGMVDTVTLTEKHVATYSADLRDEQLREIGREVERARQLVASGAEPSTFGDSSCFIRFDATDEARGATRAALDHDAIERVRMLAGYGMLVTSELALPDDEAVRTYWRLREGIEAFRDTLTRLEDMSVFTHEDTIAGHLVVCYTSVLLMRLLQTHVLDDRYTLDDITDFMRTFEVVRASDRTYVNLARRSEVGDALSEITRLPIKAYQLTKAQCNRILSYRLKETRGRA